MEEIIDLKNKPLVEAIFELRWQMPENSTGVFVDPHYKLLVGRLFDRVRGDYPHHEPLPSATMPDEFVAYIVQHRFRKAKDCWPLIQIGPGVITLNDTAGYQWPDFKDRINRLLEAIFGIVPDLEAVFKPNRLLLRYIDAVELPSEGGNVFDFLREKLKTTIHIDDRLFKDTGVQSEPLLFDVRVSFLTSKPTGIAHLRFARGEKSGKDALIWETQVESSGTDLPTSKEAIELWSIDARALTHDWFFKMIEGDLRKRFE
ncbi:MAG: TIGR04255 family protein [candidate division Zixibacteria bacterium]|nr:TIGR04255 family protein [candidate division Zixibacteria bacterium]